MTAKEEYILSIYEELSDVGNHNNAKLVKCSLDGMLYVKKNLTNYNIDIYEKLKKIRISGVPKIHEIIEDEGKLIVIEDYINGRNLGDFREGKLSIDKAKDIVLSLCDILSELHSMKPPIVHRDIKPENIIITDDDKIYLVDFNISRQYVDNKNIDTVIMGTSGYAAPEQFGFAQTDARADIYSLGILMRNITGVFENPQYKDEIKWHKITEKCVKFDPDARYQNVEELKKAIKISFDNEKIHEEEKSFLPPGFRTGNIGNMFIASIVYILIFWMAFTLEQEEGTKLDLWLMRTAFAGMCLGYIFSFYNWRGMFNRLPAVFRKNVILRVVASMLVAVTILFAMALIAAFVG